MKVFLEGLKEGQEHAEEIERERFARSLTVEPSKFIEGPPVPLPKLNPDGTLKPGK